MISNLTKEQREQLEKALLDSFTEKDLQRMLNLELGMQLEHVVDTGQNLKNLVNELVSVAIREQWVDRLVIGAFRDNPNSRLQNMLLLLNITVTEKSVKRSENISLYETETKQNLEKIINQRSTFSNFRDFNKQLENLGVQVCRIEIPKGTAKGTGWLVGPDLLLTAYHVIEDVIHNIQNHKNVFCRFDYIEDLSGNNISNGTGCSMADNWLIDYSPYAEMDLGNSSNEPTIEELDYALLRLDSPVGNETLPTGEHRGWIKVTERPTVVNPDDLMLIVQHPKGQPLQIAFGNILSSNKISTRLRYDTNTEHGSSGAPCFNINLMPFGLHHASGPSDNLPFNQCVPLNRIIELMKRREVPKFWNSNQTTL